MPGAKACVLDSTDQSQVAPLPTGAEGPIRLQHDVADLARDAVGPRIELTAQQDAGPDAGGYRDVDHLAGPTRGATSMFAQRGEVCVVVEEAGDAGCPGQDPVERDVPEAGQVARADDKTRRGVDRKSTRLNSSHLVISYAVFCLKKK